MSFKDQIKCKKLSDYIAPTIREGGEEVLVITSDRASRSSLTSFSSSRKQVCASIIKHYVADGVEGFDDLWEKLAPIYKKRFGKELVEECYYGIKD